MGKILGKEIISMHAGEQSSSSEMDFQYLVTPTHPILICGRQSAVTSQITVLRPVSYTYSFLSRLLKFYSDVGVTDIGLSKKYKICLSFIEAKDNKVCSVAGNSGSCNPIN